MSMWGEVERKPDISDGYDAPTQLQVLKGERIHFKRAEGQEQSVPPISEKEDGVITGVSSEPDDWGYYLEVLWDDGVKMRVHLPLAGEFSVGN